MFEIGDIALAITGLVVIAASCVLRKDIMRLWEEFQKEQQEKHSR